MKTCNEDLQINSKLLDRETVHKLERWLGMLCLVSFHGLRLPGLIAWSQFASFLHVVHSALVDV